MGEIIKFEKKVQRQEREKPEKPKSALWWRLDEATQQMFISGLKGINASKEARQINIRKEKLKEQRELVSGWSDKETLNFLSNPANREELKAKPHLLVALFEKVSGKL